MPDLLIHNARIWTNDPAQPWADAALARAYDKAYPAYAQAHAALRPVWRTMARARGDQA